MRYTLNCSCRPGTCRYADIHAARIWKRTHGNFRRSDRFRNYHPRLLAADFVIRDRHALIIYIRNNEVIFAYAKKTARTLVKEIEDNRGEKAMQRGWEGDSRTVMTKVNDRLVEVLLLYTFYPWDINTRQRRESNWDS